MTQPEGRKKRKLGNMFWKRILPALLLCVATASAKRKDTFNRLDAAATVFGEIMQVSDRAIPQELLDKAECIVVIPGLKKAAFIVGGQFGRGFITCRRDAGRGWGAPGAIRVEGGSFGLQIGGQETDIILLVMSRSGAMRLMSSKFTLGGEVSVAAGPVGRESTASTDVTMRAEILSYSRARGIFGGVALKGGTLREDAEVNDDLYPGSEKKNKDIVLGATQAPKEAAKFMQLLAKYSSRKRA